MNEGGLTTRIKLLWALFIVILITSGTAVAFGQWYVPQTIAEALEDIIMGLELDINRAIQESSAHPAFLAALQDYLADLHVLLLQMRSGVVEEEWRDWTATHSGDPLENLGSLAGRREVVFEDRFGGDVLSPFWEPLQDNGGSFAQFARMSPDQLTIDVPVGNNWGVTGVVSSQPVFTIEESMTERPLEITIFSDPVFTTSIVVYLTPQKTTGNPWYTGSFACVLWSRPEQGEAVLAAYDGQRIVQQMERDSDASPSKLTLTVYPGRIVYQIAELAVSWPIEYDWLQPGTPLHLSVHAQGYQPGMPSKLALRSVLIERVFPAP